MLKAALFDMDGLMFDTERIYDESWQKAGKEYGINVTGEIVTKMRGTNDAAVRRICREEFGESFDFERFYADTVKIVQHILSLNVPHRPYLVDMLEYLKSRGIKMAVASSTKRETVELYLNKANVRHYFDAVIGGDMVEKSKPEPDIYLTAAKAIGENPENCVAFEDSFNGIKSAKAAGCVTIMVPDMDAPIPEIIALCDNISDSLKSAIEYLEGLK